MLKNFKKIIATVAALAIASSSFVAMAATYPDVTPDASYYAAVEQLSALGMIAGFDDGTFKAEEKVTRAQMAKLVVGAKNLLAAAESNTTQKFDDVKADHWAVGYVAEGVAQGIINGTSETTFDPEATVTFAQATKMLVNACGYDEYAQIAGGWPNGYLTWGSELGINKGVTGVSNDTELTRGQVAQMIANAIKAPILKVAKYTVDNGVRVPEYKQMDGKEGRAFESLLTNEWNTYEVYGRVNGTSRATGSTLKPGEVNYLVEKADNFDGAAYTGKYVGDDTLGNPVYNTVQVNNVASLASGAESYYLEYTYALINVNDDDEASIVYIETAGKNVVVAFDDETLKPTAPSASAATVIDLYKSATTTSSKAYNLSAGVKLIVNGVEITGPVTLNTLFHATTGYLTNSFENGYLIDSPQAGQTSTDGLYDYITIDSYVTGVVDEVIVKKDGDVKVITNNGTIDVDADDEDTVYNLALTDGTEIEITELQKNDVLSIQADPTNFASSSFYNVIVSRDTAEGKVTGSGTDATGATVYTVGDAEYKFNAQLGGSLTPLTTYTLYLDKDGNIAKSEVLAASVNYAIVDRYFTNAGETKVRLILKDGSKVDYAIKADTSNLGTTNMTVNNQFPLLDGSGQLIASTTAGTAIKTIDRFVEYSVNNAGEVTLKAINPAKIATTANATGDAYDERSERIGSYGVSDTSVILNAAEFATDTTKAITVADKANLVDDMNYIAVFLGDRNTSDGTYPMVVMLTGNYGYTVSSELMIAAGAVKDITVDGSTVKAIPVYAEDGTVTDLILDAAAKDSTSAANVGGVNTFSNFNTANIVEGTPFVAATNSAGEVTEIWTLLAPGTDFVNNAAMLAKTATAIAEPDQDAVTAGTQDLVFKGEAAGKTVSFVVAPVVKKYAAGIALATDAALNTTPDPDQYESADTGVFYSYAAEAKAYSYDATVRAGSRVAKLDSTAEVTASVITSAGMTAPGSTTVNWSSTNNTPAFAIARVYDGDIQEIYSITLN